MRRRRWILVLAVILALFVGAAVAMWNVAQAPAVSAFYDPPSDWPTESGALIRTESIASQDDESIWRILYVSRDLDGNPIPVSGLIAIPGGPAPADGFPLVAVGHGTTGVARGCAPSIAPYQGSGLGSIYSAEIEPFIDAGYAVVMSDYQGMGAPGDPSYVIGKLEGQNVLDSIRAAHAFPDAELSGELLLFGHSQGGHAAAFAAELAPDYAAELDILGVSLGAPASDFDGMLHDILDKDERGPLTALALYVVKAWGTTYPELSVEEATTTLGREAIRTVIDNTCLFISGLAGSFVRPSLLIDAGAIEGWSEQLDENTAGTEPIEPPLFVVQGDADEIIAIQFTDTLVERQCGFGGPVEYRVYPGAGHISLLDDAMPDVLTWMQDRLDRLPAPPTC